jgi:hypothetical protein
MKTTIVVFIFSSTFVMCGCMQNNNKKKNLLDSWGRYCPDPNPFSSSETKNIRIQNDEFGVVCNHEEEALNRLDRSFWCDITISEAEKYLGRTLKKASEGRIVLIRGLAFTESRDGFSITWHEGLVRVNWSGHVGNMDMNRRALVSRLPASPKEVYVDCTVED